MKEDCKKCDMWMEQIGRCLLCMEKSCYQRLEGIPVRVEPDYIEIAAGITT